MYRASTPDPAGRCARVTRDNSWAANQPEWARRLGRWLLGLWFAATHPCRLVDALWRARWMDAFLRRARSQHVDLPMRRGPLLPPSQAIRILRGYETFLERLRPVLRLTCYRRALLLLSKASRVGLSPTVVFGVRAAPADANSLEGHAWLAEGQNLGLRLRSGEGDYTPTMTARAVDAAPLPTSPLDRLAVQVVQAYHTPQDEAIVADLREGLAHCDDPLRLLGVLTRRRVLMLMHAVTSREPDLQAIPGWVAALTAAAAPCYVVRDRVCEVAEAVVEVLRQNGMPFELIKGTKISALWPEYGRLRMTHDVEILAPEEVLPDIYHLCSGLGLRQKPVPRYIIPTDPEAKHLPELVTPDGLATVELHASLPTVTQMSHAEYRRAAEMWGEGFLAVATCAGHHACVHHYIRDPRTLSDVWFGMLQECVDIPTLVEWAWQNEEGTAFRAAISWMLRHLPKHLPGGRGQG